MLIKTMDRRFFLRGAGGLTLGLPFLGSLAGKARAAVTPGLLNNVVFMRLDYTWGWENVRPAPGLTYEDLGNGMKRAPLPADFSQWGQSYALADAKLKGLRDQIAFCIGLDYTGSRGDHWNNCFQSGSARMFGSNDGAMTELCGETVDQLLGRKIYKKRGQSPIINAAVVGYNDFGSTACVLNTDGSFAVPDMTRNRGKLANVPHYDVADLYQALFSGVAATAADQRVANVRDQSMLNQVYEQYRSLLANPRLSGVDKENLQNYLAMLGDFEHRLAAKKSIQCKVPGGAAPNSGRDNGYYNPEVATADLLPILASALVCGATRVVTHCLYSANLAAITAVVNENNATLPAANTSDYHHGIIHSLGFGPDGDTAVGNGDAPTPITRALALAARVDAAHLGVAADLATILQGFKDEANGQTLLDQTAIIVGREHGTCGRHMDVHMLRDNHNLVIGGGVAFDTGYYYDYKTSTAVGPNYGGPGSRQFLGLPYNDFLYATMLAMGLTPEDWELGGERGFGFTSDKANANGGNQSYLVRDMRSPPPKLLKGF